MYQYACLHTVDSYCARAVLFHFAFFFQGICIPPEVEQGDREGGTEFEAAEGGGFDEGHGTKNVSNEVDAENLVRKCSRACMFSTIGRHFLCEMGTGVKISTMQQEHIVNYSVTFPAIMEMH